MSAEPSPRPEPGDYNAVSAALDAAIARTSRWQGNGHLVGAQ